MTKQIIHYLCQGDIDYEKHQAISFKPKTKVEHVFESTDQDKLDLAEKNISIFKQFIQ